ncbi:C2H2 type zinc finger domain-containing protein [Colletotrichum truncatum]|uniref:C2H2 type zinc finger domain-containing protein n=1 Tax=Colletotrichum truncatum TaxID=5467 RepID=A0ACC3YFR6_COLTU|nr:C2H2 type zinc finger domain-containing protein [Colletotrichum truncatum]KAF6784573.1 C2H2 type zinc finger domain-containing protein [Colletotrichum truncatum]
MTASATQSHFQHPPTSDCYDPDDVLPRDSPQMQPHRPKLQPSPSPPPTFSSGRKSSQGRRKVEPIQGDAVLVAHLGNGRQPEIAHAAALEPLASDNGSEDDSSSPESPERDMNRPPESFDLKFLAAGALARAFTAPSSAEAPTSEAATAISTVKIDPSRTRNGSRLQPGTVLPGISTRELPIRDDRPTLAAPAVVYPAGDKHPAHQPPLALHKAEVASPVSPPQSAPGGLPPLLDSPKSDGSGHGPLPSIRSQLGDLKHLAESAISTDKDLGPVRHAASFPRSPPASLPRLPSLAGLPGGHGSPPISPNEGFRRELPSPAHSIAVVSPYYYSSSSGGGPHRPSADYSSGTAETPSTDQTASTPANSVADRMSIDGLTNPQAGYVCTFTGCNAAPFQTQYLLNSHANVHSSARPHYCSVKGCPRSEGGKGFKRKNEMIRHGLVHDSPGYVCPFCPDREHKYPRPDNLQRHVRVHHVDKDKDDPLLREVLSQRPDGPNRGRRRRGGPS